VFARPDDPRLGSVAEFWTGDPAALRPGRPVLIGFPQDEGVRRNHGRVGSAAAPHEIRRWLYRLTPHDPAREVDLGALALLDLGDVRVTADLEASQQALGEVVAAVLSAGAVPVVLGGGHETAYGHFLGYATLRRGVGIINLDAHLDVRPLFGEHGHSGSPFRQALEHPDAPLPGERYVCLGVQPFSSAREQVSYAKERGCRIGWCEEVRGGLGERLEAECKRLGKGGNPVSLSVDADVVSSADVPGVSAPNPLGLSGLEVVDCALRAGKSGRVSSFDVVEINPHFDADGRSARWAALLVWHFLAGRASLAPP
jgi:formiminoglutamase